MFIRKPVCWAVAIGWAMGRGDGQGRWAGAGHRHGYHPRSSLITFPRGVKQSIFRGHAKLLIPWVHGQVLCPATGPGGPFFASRSVQSGTSPRAFRDVVARPRRAIRSDNGCESCSAWLGLCILGQDIEIPAVNVDPIALFSGDLFQNACFDKRFDRFIGRWLCAPCQFQRLGR